MSGDHGYDPFGLAEPNPAMEAAVAEIDELQAELARLRAELETSEARADAFLQEGEGFQNEIARLRRGPCDICRNWYREVDRLRAENERLRTALGAVEWLRTGHGGARCPSCGYYFGELDHKRHSHDCPLAAALKDVPCP